MALRDIQEAWKGSTAGDRLSFLLSLEGFTLGGRVDYGALLPIQGPRPKPPHAMAPPELVKLITQGSTLTWVAERVGCHEKTVRRWWRGIRVPQQRYLKVLRDLAA